MFADFEAVMSTRVMVRDGTPAVPSSIEKDSWFCGLRCRRTEICIGYNFHRSSGVCEPLTVRKGLLTDGKMLWGSQEVIVYHIKTLSDWDHFERIY